MGKVSGKVYFVTGASTVSGRMARVTQTIMRARERWSDNANVLSYPLAPPLQSSAAMRRPDLA